MPLKTVVNSDVNANKKEYHGNIGPVVEIRELNFYILTSRNYKIIWKARRQ